MDWKKGNSPACPTCGASIAGSSFMYPARTHKNRQIDTGVAMPRMTFFCRQCKLKAMPSWLAYSFEKFGYLPLSCEGQVVFLNHNGFLRLMKVSVGSARIIDDCVQLEIFGPKMPYKVTLELLRLYHELNGDQNLIKIILEYLHYEYAILSRARTFSEYTQKMWRSHSMSLIVSVTELKTSTPFFHPSVRGITDTKVLEKANDLMKRKHSQVFQETLLTEIPQNDLMNPWTEFTEEEMDTILDVDSMKSS